MIIGGTHAGASVQRTGHRSVRLRRSTPATSAPIEAITLAVKVDAFMPVFSSRRPVGIDGADLLAADSRSHVVRNRSTALGAARPWTAVAPGGPPGSPSDTRSGYAAVGLRRLVAGLLVADIAAVVGIRGWPRARAMQPATSTRTQPTETLRMDRSTAAVRGTSHSPSRDQTSSKPTRPTRSQG